jgi:hypothetical protein
VSEEFASKKNYYLIILRTIISCYRKHEEFLLPDTWQSVGSLFLRE